MKKIEVLVIGYVVQMELCSGLEHFFQAVPRTDIPEYPVLEVAQQDVFRLFIFRQTDVIHECLPDILPFQRIFTV